MSNDIPSLTRDEAAARARDVSVERYDIEVDLTGLLDGAELRATSTTTFRATPGGETFADCAAEVRSATLNGRPVPESDLGPGRIRLTGLAEHNVLVVASTQTEVRSQAGVQRCVDPLDGEVYVWTTFEPDDARRCWACFDQPDLKAVHGFTVLAPTAWRVVSNSAADSVTEGQGGRRWVFADTPRLSPYVTVVNAGPFYELRSSRGGHDLGLLCRQSLSAMLDRDAEELFAMTEAGLAFFGEQFGSPFPQAKYDHVFIPDMPGAMENWGCVTCGDFALYRTPPTHGERALRTEFVLHEMAHMWFGDLVTMTWWDDLWLNEAFASWASVWASARTTEFTAAWADFATGEKLAGYRSDKAPTTHPIRQPARDVEEATASFDGITYVKGASVLRQLVALVGEDVFVEALRGYFADHAYGNTTLADLVGAVETASGRDLAGWTTSWLDRAGTDRIEVVASSGAQDWAVRVVSPDAEAPRTHRVDLGVYAPEESTGSASEVSWRRTALLELELGEEPTAIASPPGGALLLVNDGDLTFAAARPDPDSLARIGEHADRLPSSLARGLAVATVWDLLTDGEVASSELVHAATRVLAVEEDPGVTENLLRIAERAAELWSAPQVRDRLVADVADTAARLSERPDLREAALRVLARTAVTSEHLSLVEEAARDDVEVGWLALTRRAELGELDKAELEDLDARDPDPDSWIRRLEVHTALPDRQAKEAAWQAVFVDDRVPADNAAGVARALWRPSQAALLREFTARYVETAAGLGGGMMRASTLRRVFFPYACGDEALLSELEERAGSAGANATLRSDLLEPADTLRRMLRARSRVS